MPHEKKNQHVFWEHDFTKTERSKKTRFLNSVRLTKNTPQNEKENERIVKRNEKAMEDNIMVAIPALGLPASSKREDFISRMLRVGGGN